MRTTIFCLVVMGLSILSCRELSRPKTSHVVVQSNAVPGIYHKEDDPSFLFHEDTLYYEHERYDGYSFRLFPTGDTSSVTGYKNGLLEAVAKKWYSPNNLQEVREYSLGMKTGTHYGYWENGQPKFEYHFVSGEHEGLLKEWYANGQPYRIFHYSKGYEEGSQKMWWENGVIRANYVVRGGRRFGLIGLKLCMNPGN